MRKISLALLSRAVLALCLASSALGQTDPNIDRARTLLDEALKDKNPDTRRHAVQALSLTRAREPWLGDLETAVQDKDMEVQLSAIASLLDLKTDRTVPALERALNSPVHEVAFAAAKALWSLKQPVGEDALISVLGGEMKTGSGYFTAQKRDALRMMHTPRATFFFMVMTGAQMAPVPGLGFGASSVQGLLSDPSISGRASAALLLANDKDPRVLDALKDALNDKDWSVRAAAAHAIALRNDRKLAPALLPLFDDKRDGVRVRAAAAYLRLTTLK